MLKRYTLPEMRELWQRPETKFEFWLKVELAYLRARAVIGKIAWAVYEKIRDNAKINVARIEEIDAKIEHDMIAFGDDVRESLVEAGVGEHKEEFHKELTSYDVEDPALILMLRGAVEMILQKLGGLREALDKLAAIHKWTFMIMRTHGQFAEPGTFGQMLLVHSCEIDRSVRRLRTVLDEELSEGKMSGAVGNFAGMDPQLEEIALRELGLKPAMAETQILQRDRHAALMAAIAIAGGSIERMARTFWEMMRSDAGELMEPRKKDQKGSSAMAHKRNPIITERLIGMARLLRGDLNAAMENIATPECRDISQSSVERHIFPDATSLLHYMCVKATWVVENLIVNEKRMRENLETATRGVWAGQRVRNALMEAGIDYETAYRYVQACCFRATDERLNVWDIFSEAPVSEDKSARELIGEEKFAECFDLKSYLEEGVEHIFARCA